MNQSNNTVMNNQNFGILGFVGTYFLWTISSLIHNITMQNVASFFTALSGAVVTIVTLYNFFKKPKK